MIMTQLIAQHARSPKTTVCANSAPALPTDRRKSKEARKARKSRLERVTFALALSIAVLLLAWGAVGEAETSFLQSLFISRAVQDMTFAVEEGASPDLRFPNSGPYDLRLGY